MKDKVKAFIESVKSETPHMIIIYVEGGTAEIQGIGLSEYMADTIGDAFVDSLRLSSEINIILNED